MDLPYMSEMNNSRLRWRRLKCGYCMHFDTTRSTVLFMRTQEILLQYPMRTCAISLMKNDIHGRCTVCNG